MHEVCAGKGWCGGVIDGRQCHVTDFLPESGEVTADQFVAWVFAAEGVDPLKDWIKWRTHFDGLREAFVRHMGGASVRVDKLRYEGC
jgi:hypothetical protein